MTGGVQVCEAVNTISDVAQGRHSSGMSSYEGNGELAAALDDFDDQVEDSLSLSTLYSLLSSLSSQVIINPLYYEESKFRPSLEERLESIISGAALMADSSCTR